jgi:hypothetical protein
MPSGERPPSPTTIERVIAAWQRTRDGLTADEQLPTDEHVVRIDDDDPLIETEADVEAVLGRLVRAMLFAQLRASEAADLARAMTARKLRYERRGELIRGTIHDILVATERLSVVTPEGTVALRRIAPSVLILDPALIPDEYIVEKIERNPDRRAILADLVEGVVINGCVLSNGGTGLTFYPAKAAPDKQEVLR